ncbi:DUF1616 domain-containing protein [Halobellus salinisoli]|uniref:DUF1616 domain-containing protein n=1 Tax=Halobellus salinisoli TaxID=3108500 RepID=UPI003008C4E9
MRGDGVGHGSSFGRISYAPVDLLLTGLVGTVAYLLVAVDSGALRLLAGGVLLWVLPGYVTLAALFPRISVDVDRSDSGARTGLSLRQRGMLTLGVSPFVLVLIGLVVGTVYPTITADLVSRAVLAYVLIGGGIAAVRRYRIPPGTRFSLPVQSWVDEAVEAFTRGSLTNRVLTVGVVCSVLLTVGAFGFAVGTGPAEQTYTDFYLVTPDGDGEYISGGYPENLTVGQEATLTWGIHNAESEPTSYTVVVVLERVVESGGDSRVIESEELNRTAVDLDSDGAERRNHTVRPSMVGEDLRLGYYLYRGEAPDRVRAETAYRHLHVWTTVSPSS